MLKKAAIYSLILLGFSSCFKKEDPIQLPIGTSEITTLYLGNEYENEMYFDLSTGAYMQKQRIEWDMRFETTDTGWGIFVNTGANIKVRRLDLYHLNEPKNFDTSEFMQLPVLQEAPDGRPEHSAFSDWRKYKSGNGASTIHGIYIVELSHTTGQKRLKRFQIESVDDTAFTCVITDLYDASGNALLFNNNKTIIRKNKNQNYTYLSFKNYTHIVQNQEPDKDKWDFVFSRYTHLFPGILPNGALFPYNVTGVLSSRNNVAIARDSVTNFGDINGMMINNYTYSTDANVIGFDWKSHSFSAAGTYTVNSKLTYIIRDTDGAYYKLRFLDFYNAKGEKGYPKFEYERIK